jgi:hypothetical protein
MEIGGLIGQPHFAADWRSTRSRGAHGVTGWRRGRAEVTGYITRRLVSSRACGLPDVLVTGREQEPPARRKCKGRREEARACGKLSQPAEEASRRPVTGNINQRPKVGPCLHHAQC